MLAYNSKALDNLHIREETVKAVDAHLITNDEAANIAAKHQVNLYTPNVFLRVGLFLLSVVIISMGCGIFIMISSSVRFELILPFFTVATYAALELLIHFRRHYRSGVDDALLWSAMGFLFSSLVTNIHPDSERVVSFEGLMVALFAAVRFRNSIMAGIAFLSTLAFIFFTVSSSVDAAKSVMPFVLALVSIASFLLIRKIDDRHSFRHYRNCFLVIKILSLVTFYTSLNFFVVRETANEIFNLHLNPGQPITAGWFFWLATFLIPVSYILIGVRKKDAMLLRIGLLLVVATVFTYRNYYSIAPIEVIMTIAGVLMIGVCYFLSRLLAAPRNGITAKENNDPNIPAYLQLEAIAVAEKFHAPADVQPHFQFGGGTSGGGGATGNW